MDSITTYDGLIAQASAFYNREYTVSGKLILRLYSNYLNGVMSMKSLSLGDIVECSYSGYEPKDLNVGSWDVALEDNKVVVSYAEQTFSLPQGTTVNGYFITTDEASPIVVHAEALGSLVTLAPTLYKVTPRVIHTSAPYLVAV